MNPDDSNRRTGVRYQPDEKPPMALTFGLGLQLAILSVATTVLVPAIIIRAAGGTESYLSWAVFAAVAVCGATTVLQAVRFGQIGSGYVLLMSISGASIAVSITALAEGGRRCSPPWSSSPRSSRSRFPRGSRCSGES